MAPDGTGDSGGRSVGYDRLLRLNCLAADHTRSCDTRDYPKHCTDRGSDEGPHSTAHRDSPFILIPEL